MSNIYRKPNQVIQPWMFGHPEKKSTCLWLKGLPLLQETNNVALELFSIPRCKRNRLFRLPPSLDRSTIRSKTYPGIAKAMAEQWSKLLHDTHRHA